MGIQIQEAQKTQTRMKANRFTLKQIMINRQCQNNLNGGKIKITYHIKDSLHDIVSGFLSIKFIDNMGQG